MEVRPRTPTKTATTFWLGLFESICVEKEIVLDLKSCSAIELHEVLGKFYLGLRMKNGECYKKASYLAARAAISRYMAVDLSKPTCNVFRQAEFQRSNNILDGGLKQAKASGVERAVEHMEAITADDSEKIRRYFYDVLDVGDPVKLTHFCWFHLSIDPLDPFNRKLALVGTTKHKRTEKRTELILFDLIYLVLDSTDKNSQSISHRHQDVLLN